MFSLPLLYTMEVWWAGFILHPWRILLFGGGTFLLLMLYNRFAGLRRNASWAEVVIDSVEEMGIGILLAALVLWLTGQIGVGGGAMETLGKISVEALTVSIGVSVGTAQLGADDEGQSGISGDGDADPDEYLSQAALALCGGVLFAANIAPTDEVWVIASENGPWRCLGIAAFSIVLGGLILFFADFRGSRIHVARDGVLLRIRGVVTTYAISLFAAASMLWFFGKLQGEPLEHVLSMIVVLAFPAVLGASAGRLLLQKQEPSPSSSRR
jgi:putative integral membrane protein (TIGR02587 family)